MPSLLVLVFFFLVIYTPNVYGDLSKSYGESLFSGVFAEKAKNKAASEHPFKLQLLSKNGDLLDHVVSYNCGDQYQIQLVSLEKEKTFRGFLISAYSKTTHGHRSVGTFSQPVSTVNWKAATCYNANDCATNATDVQKHSVLLTWIAPCEATDVSFWYTVIDSSGKLHGPIHRLALVHRTTNENPRIRRELEEGLGFLPFFEIANGSVSVDITSRDTCSSAIPISTGLRFGGIDNRFTELYICENGIISVGSSLASSFSDNIEPFPLEESRSRLIAPLWSDVDVVGTTGGRIFYQIFTDDSDSDLLYQVSQFIYRQYYSQVTFTGKWMIVVEWSNVPPHSSSEGSDLRRNTYQAIIITDGGLAFAVFTYRCGSLEWFSAALFSTFQSVVGINDGNGCCASLAFNSTSNLEAFACRNLELGEGWSNLNYSLASQNPELPIVLPKSSRVNALLGDNVTLEFAISSYPNVYESSIRLQFRQFTNVTCGGDIQTSGDSLVLSCTRNNSRVFVTIVGVSLEAAGLYTLTAGNERGNGVNITDLAVQNFDSSVCGDFCDIARTNDPNAQAAQLANITQETAGLDAAEIAVTSVLLGDLSTEAVNNSQVRGDYLQIIDNLLQVDSSVLLESQIQNQSSSRVLFSLENFVDRVQLQPSNNTADETFTQTTYAFQLHDIPDPNQFTGQDFSVNLGTAADAKSIDPSAEIDQIALTTTLNKTATAYVRVPSAGQSRSRLAFFVFLQDGFFQNVDENVTVGSIVLGVTVPSGSDNLTMGFRYTKEENMVPDCSMFDPVGNGGLGMWTNESCREVPCRPGAPELDDQVCCECNTGSRQSRFSRQAPNRGGYPIGHFGLLLSPQVPDLPPEFALTLAIFSIIGSVLSLLSLTLLVVTYIASKKLRTSTPGRLLINLSVSLMGLYIFFIIGGPVSGVRVVCEINSAFLHYFMLVYFGWTSAECIILYFKLVKVWGGSNLVARHYVLKAGAIIWLVPVLIVAVSAGAGNRFYFNNFFCRPFEWPFWFALILPVGIILIFDWIMFIVIMIALYKHVREDLKQSESDSSQEIKKLARFSIVLVSLFGLGWTFGFLATQYGDQNQLAFIFSFFFCLIVGLQGILLLYFHGVRSSDAVNVWNTWFLKCCPCCPCGRGKTKGKFSFKKPVAKEDNVYLESPASKDSTLPRGRSEMVESLTTITDSLTASYRPSSLVSPAYGLLANVQSPTSWDSQSSDFVTSSPTSVLVDEDTRDMVDWI